MNAKTQKTVAEGMKARSIFATPELATAYLAQCAESFSDFADIPAALVGIDSEGNFDPEIYTDQTEVMVATLRAEKQIKAIVVTAVPILDALLAREDGRAWAQKIIHKELNHVAVRPLREAANIAAVVSEMPTTLDGYIASGRDGGSGLMEAFNALYKSTNELLSEKSAAWKRARLFKNELKRALESRAYALEYYAPLEDRGEGKESLFVMALGVMKNAAEKKGLDPAIFDRWASTRNEATFNVEDEDEDDFDLDSLTDELITASTDTKPTGEAEAGTAEAATE
mgnify:CR=1 FL=1